MLDNALIALIISTLRTGLEAVDLEDTPIVQAFQPTQQGANTEATYYLYKVGDRRIGYPFKEDSWGNTTVALFTGSITGSVLTVTAVESGTLSPGQGVTAIGLPLDTLISSTGTGTGGTGTYNLNRTSLVPLSSQSMTSGVLTMLHTETCQYETTFQISALSTQNPASTTQKTAADLVNYAAYVLQSAVAVQTFEDDGVGILDVKDVRNTPFKDDRDQFEYGPSFDFVMTHKQTIIASTPVLQSEEIQILSV